MQQFRILGIGAAKLSSVDPTVNHYYVGVSLKGEYGMVARWDGFNFSNSIGGDHNASMAKYEYLIETGPTITSINDASLKATEPDSVGSDSYNQDLSERRAMNVSSVLMQGGVMRQRIAATGYGESRPIASNATDDGRAHNRRVEVYISAFRG